LELLGTISTSHVVIFWSPVRALERNVGNEHTEVEKKCK
jgi:hypothetical protein